MSKRLTQIALSGLKNHHRTTIELRTQLTALQGPNGSGKTAVISAAKIGTLGHDPAIGKTLQATRQLIAPDRSEAEVALTYEGGFAVTRRFGSSMETRVMPPKGERTERDAQTRIDAELGAFVPSFDLEAFLALSPEKRRAWLLSTLPRSAVDLTHETWRRWLGYDDADEVIRKSIDRLWQDRVLQEQSLLDGLASAIEYTREKFNEAERLRRDQVTVVEAADASAKELSERPAPDPAELERVQQEIAAAERRIGELDGLIAEADRLERQARERSHHIAVGEIRIRDARAALGAARQARAAYDPADDGEVAEALKVLQLTEAHAAEASERAPSQDELAEMALQVERAERKARAQREAVEYTAGQAAEARVELQAAKKQLSDLRQHERCPVCESLDIAKVADRLEASLAGLRERLAQRERDVEAAREQQAALDRQALDAREALEVLRDRHVAAATNTTAVERARAALARAEERRDRRVAGLDGGIERAAEDLAAAEQELERLQSIAPAAAPDVAAVEDERSALRVRLSGLRDDLRELQRALKEAGKAEGERERADRERGELARREARAQALGKLYDAQKRLRAHVIEGLVQPIEETANEILQAIDPAKRFRFIFEREGRLEFDFGFEEGGTYRSFDAASTGEDAFLAVVFVAALIAVCQPGWRVLLVDNVETVDDLRRKQLMLALTRIADRLDNVIIAGCCSFADVDGWEVIDVARLTGTVVAEAAA